MLQEPKLTKVEKHEIGKNTALQKIDHGAISIRKKCAPPLNIYRTCYDRALDPNNALEFDELQLLTPFKTPYVHHDEWLVSEAVHLTFTEFTSNATSEKKECKSILELEELSTKYLMVR